MATIVKYDARIRLARVAWFWDRSLAAKPMRIAIVAISGMHQIVINGISSTCCVYLSWVYLNRVGKMTKKIEYFPWPWGYSSRNHSHFRDIEEAQTKGSAGVAFYSWLLQRIFTQFVGVSGFFRFLFVGT